LIRNLGDHGNRFVVTSLNENVRASAALALRNATKRMSVSQMPDVPEQLLNSLALSGLEGISVEGGEIMRG
jgi:hypothetical protein